jgi:hypothetical protein
VDGDEECVVVAAAAAAAAGDGEGRFYLLESQSVVGRYGHSTMGAT